MSRNTPDHDRLLAEISLGDWTTGPAAGFARAAALSARRRQRMKRIISTTAAACAFAVTALFANHSARKSPPLAPPVSGQSIPQPAYEIISDTQLLVLVTDRPLLVVQNSPDSEPIILAFDR